MNHADEIVALLNTARDAAGLVTNCFLQEPAIRRLASEGRLEGLQSAGTVFLLQREEGFLRLFYVSRGIEKLKEAVSVLQLEPGEWITDIVGLSENTDAVVPVFASAGFSLYSKFQRMVRLTGETSNEPDAAPLEEAQYAATEDACRIHELIVTNFDARSEHLPRIEDIANAARNRTILVKRCRSEIAALLFFTREGLTSTLRYWLVRPEFRRKGLGESLLRQYFPECPNCRRFILWVRCGNDDAIRHYSRVGYRPDGAVDRILRLEKT